jgi:hypothetical protein
MSQGGLRRVEVAGNNEQQRAAYEALGKVFG